MFFSHKKSLNVKIGNNFFSFLSTRNQYFPHIPYVASKKYILRVPPIKIPIKKFVNRIFLQNKLKVFHITNMWRVYTRPTCASDFLKFMPYTGWTHKKVYRIRNYSTAFENKISIHGLYKINLSQMVPIPLSMNQFKAELQTVWIGNLENKWIQIRKKGEQ
jgi:hypothetical protein